MTFLHIKMQISVRFSSKNLLGLGFLNQPPGMNLTERLVMKIRKFPFTLFINTLSNNPSDQTGLFCSFVRRWICVWKREEAGRDKKDKFWLKLHQEFAQKWKVRAEALSKGRHVIPCHLSREFWHLFGSWAQPDLAAELHLQRSGITRIFSGFSLNDQVHPQARVHTFLLL